MSCVGLCCPVCDAIFERQLCTILNDSPCCSLKCLGLRNKVRLLGKKKKLTLAPNSGPKAPSIHLYLEQDGLPVLNKAFIQDFVSAATSFSDLAVRLEVSRGTATSLVKELELNFEHFFHGRNNPRPLEQLLRKDTKKNYTTIKKRVLEAGLLNYRCAKCGLTDKWENEPLTLDLDHINGDPTDNRLENLRLLCPNCHSQTLTYKGKRGKK